MKYSLSVLLVRYTFGELYFVKYFLESVLSTFWSKTGFTLKRSLFQMFSFQIQNAKPAFSNCPSLLESSVFVTDQYGRKSNPQKLNYILKFLRRSEERTLINCCDRTRESFKSCDLLAGQQALNQGVTARFNVTTGICAFAYFRVAFTNYPPIIHNRQLLHMLFTFIYTSTQNLYLSIKVGNSHEHHGIRYRSILLWSKCKGFISRA